MVRELVRLGSEETTEDATGCYCLDCRTVFEENTENCPDCGGLTIERSQREADPEP